MCEESQETEVRYTKNFRVVGDRNYGGRYFQDGVGILER